MEDKDRERILGIGDSKYKGPEVAMNLGVCREQRRLLCYRQRVSRVGEASRGPSPTFSNPRS